MANMEIKIIIGNDITLIGKNKRIFSTVYIDCHGTCFPDNQWTDFTESVLTSWFNSLIKKRKKKNTTFSLYFMDGSFRMDVFKNENMQLSINCINDGVVPELIKSSFTCSYYDFLQILYEAFKRFEQVLREKSMIFDGQYRYLKTTMNEIEGLLIKKNASSKKQKK